MKSFDEGAQSFIVRIWREPREIRGALPLWRGVVQHVASGERRYIATLNELVEFIGTYLRRIGVKEEK